MEPVFTRPGYVHYRIIGARGRPAARGGATLHFLPSADQQLLHTAVSVCSLEDVFSKSVGRERARQRLLHTPNVPQTFARFKIENTRPRSQLFLAFDAIVRHAWLSTSNARRGVFGSDGLYRVRDSEPVVEVA